MEKNSVLIAALLVGIFAVAGVVTMEIVARGGSLTAADAAMIARETGPGKPASFTESHFDWTYTRMLGMLVGVCGWTALALAALGLKRGGGAIYAWLAGGLGAVAIAWSSPALGVVVVILVCYHFWRGRSAANAK